MKNNFKIRFQWRTFIPIFLLGLLAECAIFSAYRMKLVTGLKVGVLFVAVCVCAFVLSILPFVQRWVDWIGQWFRSLPEKVKRNKKAILKQLMILVAISVVAIGPANLLLKIHPVKITKYVFPGMYALSWVVLFCVVYGILYRDMLKNRIEACVAVLIILLGTVYIAAEPAAIGSSWDEGIHYGRAMMMSYDFELEIPEAEIYTLDYEQTYMEKFETEKYEKWEQTLVEKSRNPKASLYGACRPKYTTLVYIPSAIILLISRALHLPFLLGIQLGKYGFLLLYALLTYLSMKKLKGGKMLVAAIMLLPQMLFMTSHYSYDTWVVSWLILSMSCFIYELQHVDEKLNMKNVILMMVSFFVGVSPKLIYIPLMLLFLFMPKSKFTSKKQRILYYGAIIIIVLCVLAMFMLPFLMASGATATDKRGGSDVDSSKQLALILGDVGGYLVVCWNFFKKYVAFSNWSSMTSLLAYNGKIPFEITSIVMLLVVAFTDKCEEDANIRWYHRGITAILSIGITLLIITALYISYTPVGADTVNGCQARYMLPLLFPMLYCVGSPKIENKTNVIAYRGIILSLLAFIVLYGIWTAIICNYV